MIISRNAARSMRSEGCVTKTAPIDKRVVIPAKHWVRLSRCMFRNAVCGTSCASASQSATVQTVYLCTSRGAVNGFSFNLFQHCSLNSADVDIWPKNKNCVGRLLNWTRSMTGYVWVVQVPSRTGGGTLINPYYRRRRNHLRDLFSFSSKGQAAGARKTKVPSRRGEAFAGQSCGRSIKLVPAARMRDT